jgi:small nuclear ribonucleoprotein
MSEMTTEILEQNLGKIVLVKLKGGKGLRGRLKGFDQHLNLVLEETDHQPRKHEKTRPYNRPRRQRGPDFSTT